MFEGIRLATNAAVYSNMQHDMLWHTHTHTHPFNGLCLGLPRWTSTRKVKPIWILLKQETVSGSGISWAICKSAPCSRQITTPAPDYSVFYRLDALPAAQPTASKPWRQQHDMLWLLCNYRTASQCIAWDVNYCHTRSMVSACLSDSHSHKLYIMMQPKRN